MSETANTKHKPEIASARYSDRGEMSSQPARYDGSCFTRRASMLDSVSERSVIWRRSGPFACFHARKGTVNDALAPCVEGSARRGLLIVSR